MQKFDNRKHKQLIEAGHREHLRLLAEPAPTPPAADASKKEWDQYNIALVKREVAQEEVDARAAEKKEAAKNK